MPRQNTGTAVENAGTLRSTANGHFAQFSIGGGQRKGVLLRGMTEAEAERRKLRIAKLVARLRETGHTSAIPNTIRDAGQLDEEGMRKLERLVERIATGKEPGLAKKLGGRREGITVEDLSGLWTSGKLAEDYPDHVRVKKTSDGDARIFAWLNKVRMPDGAPFGERPVAAVTLDDCDHVMGALPKTLEASASRRQYAQALRKLLVYAVYPLRLLSTSPIPKGWLPKVKNDKAKAWIYPSEELALMGCRRVPLPLRLLYGVLAREGLRESEALSLTWADLDLARGVIRLDVNKTDDPRSWALGDDVTRALSMWKKLRGRKAEKIPRVFPKALLGKIEGLARVLREGLKLAGVTRPELIVKKRGRIWMRAHDLRGSFVTLALAAGQTEAWVTDRTGHKSSTMIYRYKRASRSAAELALGWFAPLDEAIPELRPKGGQGANGVQTGGSTGTGGHRGRSKNTGKGASRALPVTAQMPLKSAAREGIRVRAPEGPHSNDYEYISAVGPRRRGPLAAGDPGYVCTSVCTPPLDVLKTAIDRLTHAIAAADDDAIPALVAERRDLREELAVRRDDAAGVVRLEDERARRSRRR